MKRFQRVNSPSNMIIIFSVFIVLSCFSIAFAGGDHGESGSLDHKVPLEGKSGFSLWLAVLYNDNRFLFAIVVTFTMATLGITVGYISNLALRRLGLK